MSPQPTQQRRNAPEATEPTEPPVEATTNGDASTEDKAKAEKAKAEKAAAVAALRALAEDDSMGGQQIKRAIVLEGQRSDLGTLIAKNRDFLRLMKVNDSLSAEQADAVEVFYPEKEKDARRSKDEIESTRKVKEAARVLAEEFAKEAASD